MTRLPQDLTSQPHSYRGAHVDFPLEEIMSGSADNHPEVICLKFPLCFSRPKQNVEGSRPSSHRPSGTGLLHVYRTILCWAVLSCFSHVQLFVSPWTVGDFSGKNTAGGCLLLDSYQWQKSPPLHPYNLCLNTFQKIFFNITSYYCHTV